MPYEVPSFAQLRDAYLQAVRNQNPAAATGPDSDHFVRACAVAAIGESLLSHQAWVFRQGFPDLADVDSMERMANLRGVTRRPAAAAGGTVRISGVVGTAAGRRSSLRRARSTRPRRPAWWAQAAPWISPAWPAWRAPQATSAPTRLSPSTRHRPA